MNITRENLGELELSIKIEIAENDYAERVVKTLKKYQRQATVPGFRKGMAPMGLIQRMYKANVTAEEIQNILNESLYKYIDDEKLNIIGTPLANDEKTGNVDFEKAKDFAFYFDAALAPEVNVKWDAVSTKLLQVKISAKEAEKQIEEIGQRYGKFETPETIEATDVVYGKAIELDKTGAVKEGGMTTYINFKLDQMKDDDARALFIGKKNEDKVVFNAAKCFTPSEIEKVFHLENAEAKKFKSDVEMSISGCSRITPHEVNEELFKKLFPDQEVKDAAAFKKLITKEMETANNEQCQMIYVNEVRNALMEAFDAPIPENFLKRWILSRGEKDVTSETIDAQWAEKYLPGIKWEFLSLALEKIKPLEPSQDDVINYVKGLLAKGNKPEEGQDEKEYDEQLTQSARTIASDRNNVRQIVDKLYQDNIFALFNEQLKPEVEKVTLKELSERYK